MLKIKYTEEIRKNYWIS